MPPGHREGDVGKLLAAVPDLIAVKGGAQHSDVAGGVVAAIPLAEGDHLLVQIRQRLLGVGVVPVGDDPLFGQLGKAAKGRFEVLHRLEEVQMVGVDVQHNTGVGGEVEKGVQHAI